MNGGRLSTLEMAMGRAMRQVELLSGISIASIRVLLFVPRLRGLQFMIFYGGS